MGLQEKMETDHIWIKNNPKNPIQGSNNYGQHWLNQADSNYREQLEMSYRTMGRAHDWDIEKYRKSPKSSDKGNRRRFFKNFARFVKNPYGYTFWKVNGFKKSITLFPVVVLGYLASTFICLLVMARSKKQEKGFLQYLGA